MDSENGPRVGAYAYDFYLHCMLEDLDRVDNTDITLSKVYSPLMAIAEEGKKGGVYRLIARERFRTSVEQSLWFVNADFENFEDRDSVWDAIMEEDIYWVIYFEGPGLVMTRDIDDGDSVVRALLEDRANTFIVAIEYNRGFIYVLRSPETSLGRPWKSENVDGNYHEHPFEQVTVFGEDHPDFQTTEGYSLPREMIEGALELYEKEEEAMEKNRRSRE